MIESINPSTGKVIKRFKESSRQEVLSAVQKAKKAQVLWYKQPKSERINILKNLKAVLLKHKAELFKLVEEEAGYPQEECEGDFQDIINGFDYYCGKYEKLQNADFPLDQAVLPDTKAEVQLVPHGVVGHIGIWNYPVWQTMITAIPTLLTGNAVVFKPSEFVSILSLRITELIHEAGVRELPRVSLCAQPVASDLLF